jgi:hypothetical protein
MKEYIMIKAMHDEDDDDEDEYRKLQMRTDWHKEALILLRFVLNVIVYNACLLYCLQG